MASDSRIYFGWLATAGNRFSVGEAQKNVAGKFSTQPAELRSVPTQGLEPSEARSIGCHAAISLAESLPLMDTESLKLEGQERQR